VFGKFAVVSFEISNSKTAVEVSVVVFAIPNVVVCNLRCTFKTHVAAHVSGF
jgi:hypothetical protein